MDFGRAVYSAQVVDQAADHIARELAVTPLPPDPLRSSPQCFRGYEGTGQVRGARRL